MTVASIMLSEGPSRKIFLSIAISSLLCLGAYGQRNKVLFQHDFSPQEGMITSVEMPFRKELCLNGLWKFQPVALPAGYEFEKGIVPDLPAPSEGGWDTVPIKIPSPWNVNSWATGNPASGYMPQDALDDGADYVTFPSYPLRWNETYMGWLQRSFTVPAAWDGDRIILHFEAVGGHCQIVINGKKVYEHFDSQVPFDVDITDVVKQNGKNELLVGVRRVRLFNKERGQIDYVSGSYWGDVGGIWQDVFLWGLPPVRVADVFVKPIVSQGVLALEVTVQNDTDKEVDLTISGDVQPWINLAGDDVISGPVPNWKLGEAVIKIPSERARLKPRTRKVIVLKQNVHNQLRLWSPDSPNLYGLVLSLHSEHQPIDRYYQRFGWREFDIRGTDFLLNGKKIQMTGDFSHFFGVMYTSRRFVWSFYKMIKDIHGNFVRPHAMLGPRLYLDLADEMGLMVLDETGIFGSHLRNDMQSPLFWENCKQHVEGMLRRDRNHPSVFGWSIANEMITAMKFLKKPEHEIQRVKNELKKLADRAHEMDGTRKWVSCDGDEDLDGHLPVWTKHYGHNLHNVPDLDKPMAVGESGGTYYAKPEQLSVFNGEEAFRDYRGRSEALAIDAYQNITKVAKPKLAAFAVSELVWFGLEFLPLGLDDPSRDPLPTDGVWFGPFIEGKPGMQPERIGPWSSPLNPGFDKDLPMYKPLPFFEAVKAAYAHPAQPSPWDHFHPQKMRRKITVEDPFTTVKFIGDTKAELYGRLRDIGVIFTEANKKASDRMIVIDASSIRKEQVPSARKLLERVGNRQGTVLILGLTNEQALENISGLLPEELVLTTRRATQLLPVETHPIGASFYLSDLYFAENQENKQILQKGLAGPLVDKGSVLLTAANTDWSKFNDRTESVKCAAIIRYEHKKKEPGNALVEIPLDKGKLFVTSIDCFARSAKHDRFWQQLLSRIGLQLQHENILPESEEAVKINDLLRGGPPVEE